MDASADERTDDENDYLDRFIVADDVEDYIIYHLYQYIKYFIVLVHYISHHRLLYISHAFIFLHYSFPLGVNYFLSFMDLLDYQFKHPPTIQVSGPTRRGKTSLVRCILEKQLIQPFATSII